MLDRLRAARVCAAARELARVEHERAENTLRLSLLMDDYDRERDRDTVVMLAHRLDDADAADVLRAELEAARAARLRFGFR